MMIKIIIIIFKIKQFKIYNIQLKHHKQYIAHKHIIIIKIMMLISSISSKIKTNKIIIMIIVKIK